ncbi:hypothetical protein DFQ26_004863 [Actinomortierella ambigua]|nr:hypothetical protein DFQ26_004863 [Actinomortierella ambigua]
MRLAKSLVVFAAATVVLAQDAIMSRGFFIGEDTSTPGARGPELPSKTCESYSLFQEQLRTFLGSTEGIPYYVTLRLEGGASDLQDKIQQQYPYDNEASDPALKKWLLTVVLIRKPKDSDDRVIMELVSIGLLIDTDRNGAVEVPKQDTIFVTKQYEMRTNFLVREADRLFGVVGVTSLYKFAWYFISRPPQFPNIRDWYDNGKPFHDDEGCFDF